MAENAMDLGLRGLIILVFIAYAWQSFGKPLNLFWVPFVMLTTVIGVYSCYKSFKENEKEV